MHGRSVPGAIPAIPFVVAKNVDERVLESLELPVSLLEHFVRAWRAAGFDIAVMNNERNLRPIDLGDHIRERIGRVELVVGHVTDQRELEAGIGLARPWAAYRTTGHEAEKKQGQQLDKPVQRRGPS